MPKNLTVRLDDDLAADTAALARAEGQSVNETVKTPSKVKPCGALPGGQFARSSARPCSSRQLVARMHLDLVCSDKRARRRQMSTRRSVWAVNR